jgi:hypothetical protein
MSVFRETLIFGITKKQTHSNMFVLQKKSSVFAMKKEYQEKNVEDKANHSRFSLAILKKRISCVIKMSVNQ